MRGFWKKRGGTVTVLLTVAAFYGIMMWMGITCPIKFISGRSCPGCGMTRACLSALTLDFDAAFDYHPLWIALLPFLLLLFLLRGRRRALTVTVTLGALLMVGVYAARLAEGGSIVVFDPESGFFYRLFNTII